LNFHLIAETIIIEAMKRGDFDDLPGQGKPLPGDEIDRLPEEMRMAYIILKNSGYIEKSPALPERIESSEKLMESCDEISEAVEIKRSKKKFRLFSRKAGFSMDNMRYGTSILKKFSRKK